MAEYVPLKIPVEVLDGENSAKTLEKIWQNIEKIAVAQQNLDPASKEFKALSGEFNNCLKSTSAYAKAVGDINKVNIQAQKETDRLAKAHAQQAKAAREAADPYRRLNQELKEWQSFLRSSLADGKTTELEINQIAAECRKLTSDLNNVNKRFKDLTATQKENKNVTETLKIAFGSFLGILGNQALMRMTQVFRDFVTSISQAGIALDGITNTFAAGARGWKQGGEEMEWVANTAEKLGLNLQSTYEPYAKFLTSFTRSGGTLQESRQIFEDLSTAMVSLHLSSDQMNNVFVALEQMANKGTVQAEELKRQLGNALPGAFELAAQAMDVTTAELMDMMKKGQVVSRDFLPKFAALVKDSLGTQVGIAADQYNSHLNRLKSQTFLLQTTLGQMLNEALTPVVKGLTNIVKTTNSVIKIFNQSALATTVLQSAFLAIIVTLGVYVKETIAATTATIALATAQGTVAPALTTFQKLLLGVNNLLKTKVTWTGLATIATNGLRAALTALAAHPIAATLLAIGSAALYVANSINKSKKAFQEQYVQIQDVSNNIVGLISDYSQLAAVQNRSVAQQEAYNRALESLKEAYPEILGYIDTNKINLNNLTQAQAEHIASLAIMQKMQEAEKVKSQELNDVWRQAGVFCKTWGLNIIATIQAVEAAIISLINVAGAGLQPWKLFLKSERDKLIGDITSLWGAVKQSFQDAKNVQFESVNEIEARYKNTVAKLGKEQQQIVKMLTYSSNALSNVATGKSGQEKGGKSDIKSQAEDAWQALNRQANETLELIRVNKLAGKNTEKLEKAYLGYKKQIDEVNKAIEKLNKQEKQINMTAAEQAIKIWEDKKKALQNAEKQYKGMLVAGNAYTKTEIEQQRILMRGLKAETQYNDYLANRENLMQISSRTARDFGNTLVDAIFNPMEGETFWERLRDVGLSALKSIATSWSKTLLDGMVKGFGAGFVGTGGSFFQNLQGGILGMITGAAGKQIGSFGTVGGGTLGLGSASASAASLTTILGQLQQQSNGAAQGVTNLATSALNASSNMISTATSALSAGTNISGVTSPAVSAAQSVASMAVAAPIAAVGMGALAATMTVASTAFQAAAPALTEMAGAMASLATSAATAATSMAAIAVATAAESVAKIPIVGGFLAPVAATLTGAGIAAGTAMTGAAIGASTAITGAGQMIGGAMAGIGNKLSGVSSLSKGANVVPHAKGGIVSSPTMFAMQGGNIGLAGEAGTEVIAPARRMSNGDVGIGAVQPKVTVNNYTNSAVEVIKRPDNEMEIKITELNAMLSSSRTNKGWSNAQARMSRQGRQIG